MKTKYIIACALLAVLSLCLFVGLMKILTIIFVAALTVMIFPEFWKPAVSIYKLIFPKK